MARREARKKETGFSDENILIPPRLAPIHPENEEPVETGRKRNGFAPSPLPVRIIGRIIPFKRAGNIPAAREKTKTIRLGI